MARVREGIVAGYDGSTGSDGALRLAAREARARGTLLTVCLAWAPSSPAAPREPAVYELARRENEEILAPGLRYAQSLMEPSRVKPLLATGSAAEVLRDLSGTAEMVVVGSRGHGTLPGLLLGSVAWQVAGHAEGPVVVVRGQWPPPPNHRAGPVVVGADGSPDSLAAVTFAFREAALRGVPLLAVCALADSAAVLGGARRVEEDFSSVMTRQEKENPEVTVLRQVTAGSPVRELLRATVGAQMVVVGARGRGGVPGMRLGSVPHAMLHHSPCPVSVVRPEAR